MAEAIAGIARAVRPRRFGRRARGKRDMVELAMLRHHVAAIGVALAAAGATVGIYGVRRTFATNLLTTHVPVPARKVVEVLGIVGHLARGAVFCVAGSFLIDAAVSVNPQQAQGLDGALREIAATPLGPWLLLAVALGLVIFGFYSWCEARWRAVEPG